MASNSNKNQRPLSREELIQAARQGTPVDTSGLDELSIRALKGLAYLPKNQDLADVLARMDAKVAQKTKPMPPIRRRLHYALAIAAALAIVVLVVPNLLVNHDDLSFPDCHFSQGRGGDAAEAKVLGAEAFNRKNYKEAAQHFEAALASSPDDHQLKLYLGLSYLGTQRHTDASSTLTDLLNQNPAHSITDNALWYLAKSYALAGQKDRARPILERLATDSDNFQKEAADCLRQL